MADLLFVVITAAFFALGVGYVRVCDRIIGPDPRPASEADVGASVDGASPTDGDRSDRAAVRA